MHEVRKRTSLLVESQAPADGDLWQAFIRLEESFPASFNLLKPPQWYSLQQKERFFNSGKAINPNLRPLEHEVALSVGRQEEDLLELKEVIVGADVDELIKQAYRWRINESIVNTRMAAAAINNNKRRFAAYNQFIYGEPDPAIFAAAADWFRQSALNALDHDSVEVRQVAQDVLNHVPDMRGDRNLLVPSPEIFDRVKRQHYENNGFYALLLAGVELPQAGKVPKEIGDVAIKQVLTNVGSSLKILDATGSGFSIDRQNGGVRAPTDYNWVLNRFIGLPLGHEVGGHELEYQNGLRQKLRLFAGGLDRYENGNEGRAVIREQLPYDSFEAFSKILRWQDIMRRHLAVSLAEGLATGGAKMSFSEVFSIINAIDRLWERRKKPADIEKADSIADNRGWSLLADMVFRGTDGTGGAHLLAKTYLEGNVACWQHPELIEYGDLGKFDITNSRHIALAQAFGVLPNIQQ
jgi:hypothetical protein